MSGLVILAAVLILVGAVVIATTPRHIPWPSDVQYSDTDTDE